MAFNDITKQGTKGLKGLKGLSSPSNPSNQTIEPSDFDIRLDQEEQWLRTASDREFNKRYKAAAVQDVGLQVAKSGYGESTYDEGVVLSQLPDLQDIRADKQSGFLQVTNGIAKAGVLAGTTAVDGTVGLLYGAIQALAEGRLSAVWDNDFSRGLQKLNEASEELLPNYYTKHEQEHMTFNANMAGDFLKNLGFTIGAFYSGGLLSSGIRAAGLGVMKAAKKMGAVAETIHNIGAGTKYVSAGLGAVMSAVNEGRIEALNNSDDWYKLQVAQLDDKYNADMASIEEEYQKNKGTLTRTPDGSYIDTAYLKYRQDVQRLTQAYQGSKSKLEEDRMNMGNADMLMNIPLLTMGNLFQFGKLYAGGFRTGRRANKILGNLESGFKGGTTNSQKITKSIGNILSEGTEEISQSIVSSAAGNYYEQDLNDYYKATKDGKAYKITVNQMQALSKAIGDNISDENSWKEFIMGAATGALGMPRFRSAKNAQGKWRSPVVLEGGILGEIRDTNEQIAREQRISDYLNQRRQDPKFNDYYKKLVRHNFYQDKMDKAIEDDNEFEFKNAELAQFVSDISMFDAAGRIDDLRSLIETATDISDENLQSILDNTTSLTTAKEQQEAIDAEIAELKQTEESLFNAQQDPESGEDYTEEIQEIEQRIQKLEEKKTTIRDVYSGPFAVNGNIPDLDNSTTKQEVIDKIKANTQSMLNQIDSYIKTKIELSESLPDSVTDEQLDELIYLKSQLDDWSKRGEEMSEEIQSALRSTLNTLEATKSAAQLANNEKELDTIEKSISIIQELIGLKPSVLRDVITNPKNRGIIASIGSILSGYSPSRDSVGYESRQKQLKTIDDLIKIGQASEIYQKRLDKYVNHPELQAQKHKESDKKEETKQDTSDKISQIDRINNASTSEIISSIDSGDISFDELDGIADELEVALGDNVEEAKQIISTRDSMKKEGKKQVESGEITEEELADIESLLDASAKKSESLNEFLDVETEVYNEVQNLGNINVEVNPVDSISQEELTMAAKELGQQRLDRAKSNILKLAEAARKQKEENDKYPKPQKQSEQSAEVKSPEETTGHDSVDKNTPINEVLQIEGKDITTDDFAKQIVDNIDGLSNREKAFLRGHIKLLLSYADSIMDRGLSADEALEIILESKSYKKLESYSDLLSIVDNIIAQRLIQAEERSKSQKSTESKVIKETLQEEQEEEVRDDITDIPNEENVENEADYENKRNLSEYSTEASKEEDAAEGTRSLLSRIGGILDYWRSAITEFPIHRKRGDDTPYHEQLKGVAKERIKAIWGFLKSNLAFHRVTNNMVKKGDVIHFGISKELSSKVKSPVILILNSNNEVIGSLPMPEDSTFKDYVGLQEFYNKVSQWYKDNHESLHNDGNDIAVIPSYSSTIAKNLVGQPQYSAKGDRHTLNEIFVEFTSGGEKKKVPFKLGIAVGAKGSSSTRIMATPGRRASQGPSELERTIINPLDATNGQPYLLLPTSSDKRAYVSVPITMPTYNVNNSRVANSALGKAINEVVRKLVTLKDDVEAIKQWKDQLKELLALQSININFNTSFNEGGARSTTIEVTIKRPKQTGRTVIYSGVQNEEMVAKILEGLSDTQFQISRKYINSTFNGQLYNEMIGQLAETNLPVGATHTINDWYTLNPIVNDSEQKAHSPKSTRQNTEKVESNKVRFKDSKGDNYYLTNDNVLYKENPDGNDIELTGDKYNRYKAYAHGLRVKANIEKPYDTPWGKFDAKRFNFVKEEPKKSEPKQQKPEVKQPTQAKPENTQKPTEAKDADKDTSNVETQPEKTQKSREDILKEIKNKGYLDTAERKIALSKLSTENLEALNNLDRNSANNALDEFDCSMDIDMSGADTNELFKSIIDNNGYAREVEEAIAEDKKWSIEKELKILVKILPQLSKEDRLRIMHGLIRISNQKNSGYAWGMFQNGIITIANNAARGTIYHEAFHFVAHSLLSPKEYYELIKEARNVYGNNLSMVAIEEKLAEDFRLFMQDQEDLGFFHKLFETLKHIIKSLLGQETVTNKLFFDIKRGKLVSKEYRKSNISTTNDNIYYRGIDINQEIENLQQELEATKAQKKAAASNVQERFKELNPKLSKMRNGRRLYGKIYYKSQEEAYEAIPPRYADLLTVIEIRGHHIPVYLEGLKRDAIISNSELLKDEITRLEKRIKELKDRQDSNLTMDYQDSDIFYNEETDIRQEQREIQQYHREKTEYRNLNQEQRDYLKLRGITKEEYDMMIPQQREVLFHCMY